MNCHHFSAGRCLSCHWLDRPYAQQLQQKQQQLEQLLQPFSPAEMLAPVASALQGFRHKAKMVVSGTVTEPVLGIIGSDKQAVDLTDCPLYPATFQSVLDVCKDFIRLARLEPYNIATRRGELKFILLSQSLAHGQFMLRLVLRSKNCVASITKHLGWLQQQLPELAVCSVNLQPVPMAQLEGDEEIVLTAQQVLPEKLNTIPLYMQAQSFFQTNPVMAAALYQTAADWVNTLIPQSQRHDIWDLFCGVGGFGLHLATSQTRLTGIEIAPAAIASARRSAQELGFSNITFQALDSATFAQAAEKTPDVLVVNPPRRGLGDALCADISRLAPQWLLYSSCNAVTLAADLARLPQYSLLKVQLFDMFAHSSHYEVLTLLRLQHS